MMTPQMGENKAQAPKPKETKQELTSHFFPGVDGAPGRYIDATSREEAEKIYKQNS